MKLSAQHTALGKLIFYSDIIEYFDGLDDYRQECSSVFWHKSGSHYYKVFPIHIFSPISRSGSDPRYAEVQLFKSEVYHFFNGNWGYSKNEELIGTFLLTPKGKAPRPITFPMNDGVVLQTANAASSGVVSIGEKSQNDIWRLRN